MIKKINKVLSFFLALILLAYSSALTVYADNDSVLVTVVCEIDDSIKTDSYTIVKFRLMNVSTYEMMDFDLYEYNNFTDKVVIPTGEYYLLNARIDDRNDIICKVQGETTYKIGDNKSIYFKLSDSHNLLTEKETTTETPSEITTILSKPEEESTSSLEITTLFNTDNYTANVEDDEITEAEIVTTKEEKTTTAVNDISSTAFLSQSFREQNKIESQKTIAGVMVALFIVIIIICSAFIYLKRRN